MVSFFDVTISLRKVSRKKFVVRHGVEFFVGGVEDRRLSLPFPLPPGIVLDLGTRSSVGGKEL